MEKFIDQAFPYSEPESTKDVSNWRLVELWFIEKLPVRPCDEHIEAIVRLNYFVRRRHFFGNRKERSMQVRGQAAGRGSWRTASYGLYITRIQDS